MDPDGFIRLLFPAIGQELPNKGEKSDAPKVHSAVTGVCI